VLNKLKQKWGVGNNQLFLILLNFSLTGTSTAWLSRMVTEWLLIKHYSLAWWLIKFVILFAGYQILILFFGFLLGQFHFFWEYEKRILKKLGFLKKTKQVLNVAVFASGSGSNFEKILSYFSKHPSINITLLVCNRSNAGVIQMAKNNNIKVLIIRNEEIDNSDTLEKLQHEKINYLVLAGFLRKIPVNIIKAFPRRIINIHPALLPKFGGKGMYGSYVHDAVLKAGEKESGITIHFVDEQYDSGDIIFQTTCPISNVDTAESIAKKIQHLEHKYFATEIEKLIKYQNQR